MFFSGFAGQMGRNLEQSRADEAKHAEDVAQRENRILETLAGSDDPEIASMAITGLLNQADPRQRKAKGLRGFLGEVEGNPALPTIRQLIASGKRVPIPNSQEPAALPSQSPVQPRSAPMRPGSLESPVQGGPVVGGRFSPLEKPQAPLPSRSNAGATVPRSVFLSPEERIRRDEEARLTGRLTAFRGAMGKAASPEERDIVRGLAGSPAAVRQTSTTDDDGTVHIFQNGVEVNTIPGAGKSARDPQSTLRGVKVQDPASPTGWSQVYNDQYGTEVYRILGATPYTAPPAFSGTTTIDTEQGPQRAGVNRGGTGTTPLGPAPPPAGQIDPEQALAQGVVAALDKAIADARIPGVPVQQGMRDRLVQQYNQRYGYPNRTYEQWVAASKGPTASGASPGAVQGPPGRPGTGRGRQPGSNLPPKATPSNPADPFGILNP